MAQSSLIPISQMPLKPRHWYILVAASMEQLIGGALSTIVGVIIPLIILVGSPVLDSFDQGMLGAAGLVGIAVGSVIMGQLMDAIGYLFLFRLCPALIMAGSIGVYFSDSVPWLCWWLFFTGFGVGGGYSLDSGYISELVPIRWESFFVGLAKASCALGFIGGAAVGYLILVFYPQAGVWPNMIIFIGVLGLITLLMRVRWYQSPRWLMAKGAKKRAEKTAREFFGPNAEILPLAADKNVSPALSWMDMFKGERLKKTLLSGVSWACEGLGVYGFGVFLPILVMALGIQGGGEEGVVKTLASVRTTMFINLFIAAGFAIGLAILHKINILKLMGWTFILCALSLAGLLIAYTYRLPVYVSFLFFVIFETALNAGPHLVTYVVPARIFSVEERGAGTGIATMFGKVGAVLGVFFMPAMLSWGGVNAVLWVSIIVMALGAVVTFAFGKSLKLL